MVKQLFSSPLRNWEVSWMISATGEQRHVGFFDKFQSESTVINHNAIQQRRGSNPAKRDYMRTKVIVRQASTHPPETEDFGGQPSQHCEAERRWEVTCSVYIDELTSDRSSYGYYNVVAAEALLATLRRTNKNNLAVYQIRLGGIGQSSTAPLTVVIVRKTELVSS